MTEPAVDSNCDHTRGMGRMRSTAITVCRHCRDFLCSICGCPIEWHEGLSVTNPPVQWRYCAKPACLEIEAAYHGHSVAVMSQHRSTLRAKRMLPRPPVASHLPSNTTGVATLIASSADSSTDAASLLRRPPLIKITPHPFTLDPGEACWCNLGKDCVGDHEIYLAEPMHVCGLCGKTFEITKDDPHWSTGRGPICPTEKKP